MKWTEVIVVRSAAGNRKTLESILRELVNAAGGKRRRKYIRIYTRERVDTDICVVLDHDGEKEKAGGSRLGLRIADALKEFGLVHHTVWREMEN